MNKFTITDLPEVNEEKPVLYKVYFGSNYYVHKGKKLKESLDRLLDDVFRGMRGKKSPKDYDKIVKLCLKYPAINKVSVQKLFNGDPLALLKKESTVLKFLYKDPLCLNDPETPPYKPEWMIKQTLGKRCDKDECIKSGMVNNKKQSFKFCPNCGRLNK